MQIKETNSLNPRDHMKSRSASRQSLLKSQVSKEHDKNDKDREIMNDLMTDIVQLRHRLSTQLQVAPFLTGSTGNIPGSRKSSVSKLKDMEVNINKSTLEGTTTASSDTINIMKYDKECSLENIVIEVPKLPMMRQSVEKEQHLVCTTYVPKIKRSRTFSDIHEVSNSSYSSKENSNSSLNDLHRSRSVDKMQKYPSTDTASFKSSNNLILPPESRRKNSQEKNTIGNKRKNGRTRLDGTGTSPDITPQETPHHVNDAQRNYKSKKPPNVVLSNGHANSAMQSKESEKAASHKSDNEEHISHFQRQMRKLLRRVERKAEKQRREILLARLVLLCALVFLITWLPFVVSIFVLLELSLSEYPVQIPCDNDTA